MRLRRPLFLAVLILGPAFAPTQAQAQAETQAQSVQRGMALARANCGRCHSIARSGPSPFVEAPPFRTLHKRYPVETLEEALGEGIFTGHPAMPEFQLNPGQIGDFIAFLKSLE